MRNQADDGYWNDFDGTLASYKNTGKVDAWDSSAAMFLLVAGRRQKLTGKEPSPDLLRTAKNALKCIEAVTDAAHGLTWATPKYKVKFLMDNIEVYAGLRAAETLFAAGARRPRRKKRRLRPIGLARDSRTTGTGKRNSLLTPNTKAAPLKAG